MYCYWIAIRFWVSWLVQYSRFRYWEKGLPLPAMIQAAVICTPLLYVIWTVWSVASSCWSACSSFPSQFATQRMRASCATDFHVNIFLAIDTVWYNNQIRLAFSVTVGPRQSRTMAAGCGIDVHDWVSSWCVNYFGIVQYTVWVTNKMTPSWVAYRHLVSQIILDILTNSVPIFGVSGNIPKMSLSQHLGVFFRSLLTPKS